MKYIRPLLSGLAITALLNGCTNVENFSENPSPELPENYQTTQSTDLEVVESLRDLFANEELNAIVDRALDNNPTLQNAQARLEEIGFNLKKTKSSKYPSLSANGNGGRSKATGASETSTFSARLDASWEIDVWGRLQAGYTAAKSDLAAVDADYRAARQSLAAQTMQAWFTLVSTSKILDLDQRSVASFESTEKLVNRRFELGGSTLAALDLARTDLQNARADLEASRNNRDQAARNLHLLAGDYPDNTLHATEWPRLDQSVEEGLPSELLLKRPDVAAAFERIRAADARAKVAHRERFPSFKLTGSGGRLSDTIADLGDAAFNSWSALLNLSLPIIDGGHLRSELGAANKRSEQAYYAYQSTVLNALREVENALGSELYLASEETARLAALEAAQSALDRTKRDYEEGVTTILSLLETQRRVFSTERQTINLRAARLSNRVSLALALGKGA